MTDFYYHTIRLRHTTDSKIYVVDLWTYTEIVTEERYMERVIKQYNAEGFFVSASENSWTKDETVYMSRKEYYK